MIVWLATYPRCGNSFLRAMVVANWEYRVTPIYNVNSAQWNERMALFGYADAPKPDEEFPDATVWGEWVATYLARGKRQRMIRPGCKDWLTPDIRERLAAEPSIFFVKTHERPFDRYFPGERVIQMTRHPLAALWSYKNLLDASKKREHDIVAVSAGANMFGTWSDYHECWEAAAHLPDAFTCIRYEDVNGNEEPAVREIAQLTGLPIEQVKFTDFQALQNLSPVRFRAGKNEGWRGALPAETAAAVFAHHADVAARHGYHI